MKFATRTSRFFPLLTSCLIVLSLALTTARAQRGEKSVKLPPDLLDKKVLPFDKITLTTIRSGSSNQSRRARSPPTTAKDQGRDQGASEEGAANAQG